jgi:hypothetical protein
MHDVTRRAAIVIMRVLLYLRHAAWHSTGMGESPVIFLVG